MNWKKAVVSSLVAATAGSWPAIQVAGNPPGATKEAGLERAIVMAESSKSNAVAITSR